MLWFNDRLVDEASELVALPLSDRSFLLGEGVFETLLTLGGKAVALDRHLRRLTTGAQALGISSPTLDAIAVGVTAVLQSTPDISMGRMRITLSGSSNLLITHQRYQEWSEPARLVTYPFPFNPKSPLQKIKSTSYGEYLLAFRYAQDRSADDALLFNTNDSVMEASTANIIALIGGHWVTPPLTAGPLPGITRELLTEWGLLTEREIIFEELQRCESIALISSLRSVQPVAEINGRGFKASGKIEELATLYKSALASNLNP
jgi:branched-chain amino acid aminotransferase